VRKKPIISESSEAQKVLQCRNDLDFEGVDATRVDGQNHI